MTLFINNLILNGENQERREHVESYIVKTSAIAGDARCGSGYGVCSTESRMSINALRTSEETYNGEAQRRA